MSADGVFGDVRTNVLFDVTPNLPKCRIHVLGVVYTKLTKASVVYGQHVTLSVCAEVRT